MKSLQESIIGRKGISQGFLKSNLRPGDIVKTCGGHIMIVNGNKFDFSGGYCSMSNYDDSLLRIDEESSWDIVEIYRPDTRIRSFINIGEKISNETPIWKRN